MKLHKLARKTQSLPLLVTTLLLASAEWIPFSHAETPQPFDKLAQKVLREPNPFSFIKFNPSVNLSSEDFYLQGADGKRAMDLQWVPGSFQWVRVSNGKDESGILVPRARIHSEKNGDFEIALTQVENEITIAQKKYQLRFQARAELKSHIFFDSSCSPSGIHVNEEKLEHSWVMITCHRINNTTEKGTKPLILATVLWENESQGTFTQINLDSEHPKQKFTAPNTTDSFELEAQVAPVFHHLGVSVGVGPYSSRNEVKPFATVYASYFLNDALKLASFGALPIRTNPEVDWGFYLVMEQFRGVDERISLNLLLGAHLLSYVPSTGTRTTSISGPQGIELTFRDLFAKNLNFIMGGFFYPKISDRSYLNAWVRYGSNQYFLELNFIEWQEPKPYFYSKSFGLSVGFPLFRAL